MSLKGRVMAHPFPLQIAYQTQEFLQGAMFMAAFGDLAVGAFVRQPGGVEEVERLMMNKGLAKGVSSEAWAILNKYQTLFGDVVFQSVLISLCSHWDWYIRRLAEFVRFARVHVGGPSLSSAESRNLERADHLSLVDQISTIIGATGVELQLDDVDLATLEEMALVRNLGLHNRWEVDATYLLKSRMNGLSEGELRIVPPAELHLWHQLLILVLNQMSLEVAKVYREVPPYGT